MLRYAQWAIAWSLCLGSVAMAEVETKFIDYEHEGQKLRGFLAWDASSDEKRPAVLVVHEWWGMDEYAQQRAKMLAEMGYVAFALDMYGAGKITEHPAEAGKWAMQIRENVDHWRSRADKGLEILKKQPHVDQEKMAAIGYCFGGATVMQLAYAGQPLKGVVSFHGSLPVAEGDQAKNVQCKVLVCHGANDKFIPQQRIADFQESLTKANVDWEMIYYSGAQHSFTNPAADDRGVDGLAYNEKADKRSWQHMQVFFQELFGSN